MVFVNYQHENTKQIGFTLVELILAIAITSILAAVVAANMTAAKTATAETKLKVDVKKLNNLISLYVADGGSVTGLTLPQSVVNKLKTARSNGEAKRQAGALTGRYVDVRLAVRMQSGAEASTTAPRAVWNPTTERFDIVRTPGMQGVSDFFLDDSLLETPYPTENRALSVMQYNGANGWVWAADGSNRNNAFLNPLLTALSLQDNAFDPTVTLPTKATDESSIPGTSTGGGTTGNNPTSGSTGSGGSAGGTPQGGAGPTKLPTPINTPSGGAYFAADFPTKVTISSNGAPVVGSVLRYRKNNGGTWIDYTGPIPVVPTDTITSRNFTTVPPLYSDSNGDSDTYYLLEASFTGSHLPIWTNIGGGSNLKYTTDNADPDLPLLTHGDTRLDLGNGEYLDAGVENRMELKRSSFSGVSANSDFNLGEFMILNGTTFNDSEATSATLRLSLTLSKPLAKSGTIDINFAMVSTPNTNDRLTSADTVMVQNPITPFTLTVGGVTYTLQVRLVSLDTDSGVVSGNTFYIFEGASARAALIGKFVSNK